MCLITTYLKLILTGYLPLKVMNLDFVVEIIKFKYFKICCKLKVVLPNPSSDDEEQPDRTSVMFNLKL